MACMCYCCVRERKARNEVDVSNQFENRNDQVSDPESVSNAIVTEQPEPPEFDANFDTTKIVTDHEQNADEISL